jgi:DNA gyrase subunit A
VFVTANGNVRKNSLEDFANINANGKIAMKLETNDKIVGVQICRDDQDIMLSSKKGKCIRFMAKKLRLFKGRSSKGIRGIQLTDEDKVISLSVLDSPKIDAKTIKKDEKIKKGLAKYILSITENGYGKRTSFLEYRVTNRGGKGIIGIINSPRNGNVASSLVVEENDEIILSTDKGSVMRCAVKEIRVAGRNTQGVTIKKLSGSEKVVSAIKIDDNID